MNRTVIDWFCLLSSKGVGTKTFWAMLNKYKTANDAMKHIADPFPYRKAEELISSFSGNIILAIEKSFPQDLKNSKFCPPILFYKGNIDLLKNRRISIIGARNASINGRSMAKILSKNLSKNFSIVSGLANGIDTSVHINSLESEKSTIAVMPFGVDNIYPKENGNLYKEIAKKGLIISEAMPNRTPDQGMIHARNRLIALLSEGMIIIEAASRSGTISAAQMALDLGKEVMVVPGSPLDPRYGGSNSLIKNGAPLIENHFDVLNILEKEYSHVQKNIIPEFPVFNTVKTINNSFEMVVSALSDTPISIEAVSKNLSIDVREMLNIVSELEINGIISKNSKNEIFLIA